MTKIGEGAEYALDLGYKPSRPVVRSDADVGGEIPCQVDGSPGGKDRERAGISGGECAVIAHKLPCNTARYHPKPFISGLIEN